MGMAESTDDSPYHGRLTDHAGQHDFTYITQNRQDPNAIETSSSVVDGTPAELAPTTSSEKFSAVAAPAHFLLRRRASSVDETRGADHREITV